MNFLKNEMVSMRSGLVYQGPRLQWHLTDGKDDNLTVENIIKTIFGIDPLKSMVDDLRLQTGLKTPLLKIIQKKEYIEKSFKDSVNQSETSQSGRTVGTKVMLYLKKFIPQDLVGGEKNKNLLLKSIKKAFLFGIMDLIPLYLFIKDIEIKKFVWIKHIENLRLKYKIVSALVQWLWLICKRLVASGYYVSETQRYPYQLSYFPKRAWKSQTDKEFAVMVSGKRLCPLDDSDALKMISRRSTASLRWLPKQAGLRPIISVKGDKQNPNITEAKKLINILYKKYDASMNSFKLHSLWKKLVNQTFTNGRISKRLYFVSCDIHDAYGSIKHEKILQILQEEISSQLNRKVNNFAKEITTIREAITCQTVKTSSKYYLLSRGLSQAMPLSAKLCNIYLAHLGKTMLTAFTRDPDDTLIRVVDDYLYITPDKHRAELFLETMSAGFDEYGLNINKGKTQTNLIVDSEIYYYGYLINSANLEVYIHDYKGTNASYRNSVTLKQTPVMVVEEKLKMVSRYKLNRLTTDRTYMSVEGVGRNIFHVGCIMALRLKGLMELFIETVDPDWLIKVIICCASGVAHKVYYLGASLAAESDTHSQQEKKAVNICLKKCEVIWLILRAFSMCLSHAAIVKNDLPASLIESLTSNETEVKAQIRPFILHLLSPLVSELPPHFKLNSKAE